jgi:cell division protease FtsH
LDPSDEWRIAVHEAGHAVVAHSFGLSVGDLSLRSLANCGSGLASVHPSPLPTSQSLRNMLAVLLAGRAAEVVVCGAPSAGAKTDLAIATSLAHDMNFRWGLGRLLAVRDHPAGSSLDAVERELRSASRIACGIVNERLVALERLAKELLGMRFLTAREVGRSLEAASAAGEEVVPEETIASELPPRESAVRAVPNRRG